MPKIPNPDPLTALLARFPNGIGIQALRKELKDPIPLRTLQRNLADLIRQQRVRTIGQGRAIRYTEAQLRTAEPTSVEVSADIYVPLSPEGEKIKTYVRQPRQYRQPRSYDIRMLEAYVPNVTPYLPDKLRRELHAAGHSPQETAPAGTFAQDMLNRLLIDLSWASSQLEGNTYSRLETERLIEFGQVAVGKDALETQMILNHKAAIEYLVCVVDHIGVNRPTIWERRPIRRATMGV